MLKFTLPFWIANTIFGQIWSEKLKTFKMIVGTWTNSNMLHAMVMFTFLCFTPETPFMGKFVSENQNCLFLMKFGIWSNFNMLTLMVMLTFLF